MLKRSLSTMNRYLLSTRRLIPAFRGIIAPRGMSNISYTNETSVGSSIRSVNSSSFRVADGNSATNPKTQMYCDILDQYFVENEFHLDSEKEIQQIQMLKEAMSKVFLRERPLVAIDIEAWERNNRDITEIGLAIYDPQNDSCSILPSIDTYHIIVQENRNKFNGRFVADNKRNFLGGVSYAMDLSQCRKFLNEIMLKYLTVEPGIIVGHHVKSDISWLHSMGVTISPKVEIVDTGKLHSITRSFDGSLRGILRLVDIPHGTLHNAANDAYYTLLAAMAYCDPQTRRQKRLDYYRPKSEADYKSKTKKKQGNMNDTATIVFYDCGQRLFKDLVDKD